MLKPWKILDSELVVETPWFTLRRDRCETAAGDPVPQYYTWQKRDCVIVFPVTVDRQVLLIRQYRHGLGSFAIDYPGGTIELNQSILQAAATELLEETGFDAGEYILIGSYAMDSSYSNQRVHFVIANGCRPTNQQVGNPLEETEILLVPIDTIEAFAAESIDCLLCALLTHRAIVNINRRTKV